MSCSRGYDVHGRQTFARFGSAAGPGIATAYDSIGRPSSTTSTMGGTSRALSYLYDSGGRRSRLTFPDGQYLTYEYDPAGRLTGIRENGGTLAASFTYDGLGRRQGGSAGGASTAYAYDPASRLQNLDVGSYSKPCTRRITMGQSSRYR